MALTIHTYEGDFRAYKALIAAKYNDVKVNLSLVNMDGGAHLTPEFLAMNPIGKVPVLETEQGAIFESNAIARYIARLRRDTELQGVSFFDSALVDSWLDFCSHELELPLTMWLYPVLGYQKFDAGSHAQAVTEVKKALSLLEAHLISRTYLVGEQITLADIVIASALFYPMKFLFTAGFLTPFASVHRWFVTCVNQPNFEAVLGPCFPCVEEMLADGNDKAQPAGVAGASAGAGAGAGAGGKKGGKKNKGEGKGKKNKGEGKKGGKKTAAAPAPAPAAPPAPKKEKKKGPFDGLPKSPMVLDMWKKTYSNSRGDYYASMKPFWGEILDKEGYSLWWGKYRYNSENTVAFMTSNLVGGFLQRCDEVRKYAFGSVVIFGGENAPEGGYHVEGCWLIRGQTIQPLLDCNPDAEYYDWVKVDVDNEAERTRVGHFWCAEEKIPGEQPSELVYDSKIFK